MQNTEGFEIFYSIKSPKHTWVEIMNRAIVDDFSISAKPLKIMNYIGNEKSEKKIGSTRNWNFGYTPQCWTKSGKILHTSDCTS